MALRVSSAITSKQRTFMICLLPFSNCDLLRPGWIVHGRNVDAAVSLQQTLMGRRQEWEPAEIVLIIDSHSFCETGVGIACRDQADQHAVHIHLIAVRSGSAANFPPVGELRIDRRVYGEDVTGEAVLDRDWPVQVNGRKV